MLALGLMSDEEWARFAPFLTENRARVATRYDKRVASFLAFGEIILLRY